MRQAFHTLTVATKGPGLVEFTDEARNFLRTEKIEDGLLTCFVRHTSASLVIQENADPDVQKDLQDFFAWLAQSGPRFRHTTEGPDDMPSHLRMVLTRTSEVIPIEKGRMTLGTWQGIFLFEHRRAAHTRTSEVIPIAQGRMQLGTWQGIFLFEHRRAPHRRNIVLTIVGV